jgi:hypothetical protein
VTIEEARALQVGDYYTSVELPPGLPFEAYKTVGEITKRFGEFDYEVCLLRLNHCPANFYFRWTALDNTTAHLVKFMIELEEW